MTETKKHKIVSDICTCPSGEMARYSTLYVWPVRVANCIGSEKPIHD